MVVKMIEDGTTLEIDGLALIKQINKLIEWHDEMKLTHIYIGK